MPTSSTFPELPRQPDVHGLQCMEIIGGNHAVHNHFSSPGMDIWLDSRPCEGAAGGDIHYFSMCGSGRVTRLAVADVSGHGPVMDDIAQKLRQLMRKYINLLDQTRFAQAVNQEFILHAGNDYFATIILLTYFAPTDHLIICNGGHPRPIWYSTRLARWILLDPATPDVGPSIREAKGTYRLARVSNLPLGIIERTDYHQYTVRLDKDDFVLVYTDALVEARNPLGKSLDEDGLMRVLGELVPSDARQLGQQLVERIDGWRGGAPLEDDQTIIVLHHNGTDPAPMTVGTAVRTMLKMLGLRSV
ncbi:MAG: serine/threonine-protein phosphatase [Phycisphaerae bacterium]|nr:serine/threonine-protein phosphatase [Phycisphaerae bacterium]